MGILGMGTCLLGVVEVVSTLAEMGMVRIHDVHG